MQIKVNGRGKMGMLVRRVAESRGHELLDSVVPNPNLICIDFTHPDAVIDNIRAAAAQKVNIVVGTTGWDEHENEVKKMVKAADIGMLYSPNFSIGVLLFKQMCAHAAKLMNGHSQYQCAITETHHSQKVDAPSGTAINLQHELKKQGLGVPITSVRHGFNPGNHTLIFDAPEDTITLTHQARSREGFALGAVIAAEWLKGKKGFFTMDDLL